MRGKSNFVINYPKIQVLLIKDKQCNRGLQDTTLITILLLVFMNNNNNNNNNNNTL